MINDGVGRAGRRDRQAGWFESSLPYMIPDGVNG